MKRLLVTLSAITVCMLTGPALADGLNYTYAGISVASDSFSGMGSTVTKTGYNVSGSYDVTPNVNLVGSYDSMNVNPGTITDLTLGVGYHMPMGGWDLVSDLRYRSVVVQGFPALSGLLVNVGGRVAVNDKIEARGTIGYTSVKGSGPSLTGATVDIGAVYRIAAKVGVTADYFSDPNAVQLTEARVGVRYNF